MGGDKLEKTNKDNFSKVSCCKGKERNGDDCKRSGVRCLFSVGESTACMSADKMIQKREER